MEAITYHAQWLNVINEQCSHLAPDLSVNNDCLADLARDREEQESAAASRPPSPENTLSVELAHIPSSYSDFRLEVRSES